MYLEVFGINNWGKDVGEYMQESTGVFVGLYKNFNAILLKNESSWFKESKTNILSVTVKASSCIEADAYATALHTMSIDEIIEFFEKNQEISSLVIFENENNQLEELVLNDFY